MRRTERLVFFGLRGYMATKANLVVDFKNLIGPAGKGSEVSDTGITVWLNEAKDRVASAIQDTIPDYFNKKVTTSSIAGQSEYELPSDCEKITMVSVSYDGTTYVRALPLNNIGQAIDTQQNASVIFTVDSPFYYISGNLIGFQPGFSSTLSDNIKLWYAYNPADMTEDIDEPDIPKKFHSILKYWGYGNYLDQNDEHGAAERMRIRFDEMVEKGVQQLADRQVDMPKTVEVSNDIQGLYINDFI